MTTQVLDDFVFQLSKFKYIKPEVFSYINTADKNKLLQEFSKLPKDLTVKIFRKNSKHSVLSGLVPLNLFSDESKKTKESLLKHLQILKLVTNLPANLPVSLPADLSQDLTLPAGSLTNLSGDLSEGLGSIIKNVAETISSKNIDTSSLLMSLLSGKIENNPELQSLLSTVEQQVESEISKGTITESTLTNYTATFLKNAGLHQ